VGALAYEDSTGQFDPFMTEGPLVSDDTSLPTTFLSEAIREEYIRAALHFGGGTYPEGEANMVPDPLRYDPACLTQEKDLLDIAAR